MANENPMTELPDGSGCFTATILSHEEAMKLSLKEWPLNHRISSELYHAVFEAIGEASMCWNPPPSNEVFDSNKASDVGVRLCFKIADELERRTTLQPSSVPPANCVRPFLVFDVESVGLHGEGFAVGYVVKLATGSIVAEGVFACPMMEADGSDDDRLWVSNNVPLIPANCARPIDVRSQFWALWLEWKARGAVLVADCCWPVEARFLAQCIDDDPHARNWDGPYPLHDLASMLLTVGRDPLATSERQPDELPAHHPLNDARQSARLLIDLLMMMADVGPSAEFMPSDPIIKEPAAVQLEQQQIAAALNAQRLGPQPGFHEDPHGMYVHSPGNGPGILEIGENECGQIVMNLPRDMTGHIVFSPAEARNLGEILIRRADNPEREYDPDGIGAAAREERPELYEVEPGSPSRPIPPPTNPPPPSAGHRDPVVPERVSE